MINKDMYHVLSASMRCTANYDSISKEESTIALKCSDEKNQHRLGPDIEDDLFGILRE